MAEIDLKSPEAQLKFDRRMLAVLLLKWEDTQNALADIEQQVSNFVMLHQESVTVGNVRAVFSKGRDKLDWSKAFENYLDYAEGPEKDAAMFEADNHTTKKQVTDWMDAFNHLARIAGSNEEQNAEAAHCATETVVTVDHRETCKALKLEAVVVQQAIPSVKVKFID